MLKKLLTSRLGKAAGVYTTGNALSSAVPVLLLPLFTRYMQPVEYGYVAMFQVLTMLAGPFVGLNLQSAITRQYVERDKEALAVYIGNCMLLFAASIVLVAVLFWLFPGTISAFALFPGDWLWSVLVYTSGLFVCRVILAIWQMQNRIFFYVTFQVTQTLLLVGLTGWLVMKDGRGWQGAVVAQTIAYGAFGLLALAVLGAGGWIRLRVRRADMKDALHYGVPLIPHLISAWVMTMTARLLISHRFGLGEVALYTVGYQIGMVMSLLLTSFNQAWVPWFFETLKNTETGSMQPLPTKLRIVKLTYAYNVVVVAMVAVVSLLAPFGMHIFLGAAYGGATRYVFWIATAFGFSGMYMMVTNYLFYAKKTHVLATATTTAALLNVGLTVAFLDRWGSLGAAAATAASFSLLYLVTWALSARVYPMPWRMRTEVSLAASVR
jgi:O-antigen/teichoic acid export membrane protein